uniref:Adenylyltransferase AadA C-terminal domain-containing protein n=1 Tax=Thermosporothrix sp. COM3 TaxID=2490863 RepID=A0A455SGG2_9CHLR|nr:hypothetical protein KTC_22880 [Thermosporothrix sp. COM3]
MNTTPTPYADVNAVLNELATQLQALLGSHFCGMYLYGSLALGDFDPQQSDIDFLVVTDAELPDELIEELKAFHERFARSGSPWAENIEAAYVPCEALRHTEPTEARYPQVEKEFPFLLAPLEIGWSFQRHTLYTCGVRVAGPEPRELFEPVAPEDLRRAAAAIVNLWLGEIHSPEWLDWARSRKNQAFVVLTLCRVLYVLETAQIASKPQAAHWAQAHLGERWSGLIERSLAGKYAKEDAPEEDLQETLALIQYMAEQIRAR